MKTRVAAHIIRHHAERGKKMHFSEIYLEDQLAADLQDALKEIEELERFRRLRTRHNEEMERVVGENCRLKDQLEAERGLIERADAQMCQSPIDSIEWNAYQEAFVVVLTDKDVPCFIPMPTLRGALAAAAEGQSALTSRRGANCDSIPR